MEIFEFIEKCHLTNSELALEKSEKTINEALGAISKVVKLIKNSRCEEERWLLR